VLSPQLYDVFITDEDADRFTELREGWTGDDDLHKEGLDYGANYWCVNAILADGSFSMTDRKVITVVSENTTDNINSSGITNNIFNESTKAGAECTLYIEDDVATFTEYTDGYYLGYKSEYNF